MKKEECCSVLMTTLMIAIPIGAIIALLFDVFGKALFAEYGSFMAGIMGFGGVFVLVWNQNKSTQKTVDATMYAVREELAEARNRVCDEYILDIIDAIENIGLVMNADTEAYQDSINFVDEAQKKAKRLRVLAGPNVFESNNIVIEEYLYFYKELLLVYGKKYSLENSKKASKNLNDVMQSIKGYIDLDGALLNQGVNMGWWYSSLSKEFGSEINMIAETDDSGQTVYKLPESTTRSFYYFLNGVKVQLKQMVSSRISRDIATKDRQNTF